MKNLLNYQSTEYDCGPVSIINGIRFLFEREEIPPEIIKFVTLYCMDTFNENGELCKHGTSAAAISFICSWLNHLGVRKNFPIHCEYITGEAVATSKDSKIASALRKGGVAVVRLFLGVPHYVLLTGLEGDMLFLFDPFYEETDDPELDEEYEEAGISILTDQPKRANRSVLAERLNSTDKGYYEMGDYDLREALIMYNTASNSTASS